MPRKFTEHSKAYIREYKKSHTTRITLQLNYETDRELLEYLKQIPNKNAYLKGLIKKDMAAKK